MITRCGLASGAWITVVTHSLLTTSVIDPPAMPSSNARILRAMGIDRNQFVILHYIEALHKAYHHHPSFEWLAAGYKGWEHATDTTIGLNTHYYRATPPAQSIYAQLMPSTPHQQISIIPNESSEVQEHGRIKHISCQRLSHVQLTDEKGNSTFHSNKNFFNLWCFTAFNTVPSLQPTHLRKGGHGLTQTTLSPVWLGH